MSLYSKGNAHVHLIKASQSHELSYSLAGRLNLIQTGWLVLSVPASLVRGAFDALHETGAELPVHFAIPVMSPEEVKKIGSDKISERGHSFNYTLGPVRSHEPNNGISKAWYIQIYSQDLKKLRHSYGLSPYPKGNSFQLAVGIRKTGTLQKGTKMTKLSEFLKEPNWADYDQSAIEKTADLNSNNGSPSMYQFEGDVQGVGLRKTLHQLLNQRKSEGLAYNDARANKSYVWLNHTSNPKVKDNVLRELKNYLDARDSKYKLTPLPDVDPNIRPISIDSQGIKNFVTNQGFTGMSPDDPNWRNWLIERYRLKSDNGSLSGNLPDIAARQLEGKEPVYRYQLPGHPDASRHSFTPKFAMQKILNSITRRD